MKIYFVPEKLPKKISSHAITLFKLQIEHVCTQRMALKAKTIISAEVRANQQ